MAQLSLLLPVTYMRLDVCNPNAAHSSNMTQHVCCAFAPLVLLGFGDQVVAESV